MTSGAGTPSEASARHARELWIVLAVLWIGTVTWIWTVLDEGWIPHDEGALAQAAERVLLGELPHADFDEVYTGGLDWLNAAAMRAFGVSLRSMRIALFLVFALWVPAVYWIATRFARPLVAAPFVVLAVGASLPYWAAPMPSWYTLFFATFGTAALLRWLETSRRVWIAAAGLAAGLSVLAKITGLHFAAAALLFLAWREPALSRGKDGPAPRAYPVALSALLAAFVAGLVLQVRPVAAKEGWIPQIVHFVFPGALVAALTAHRAWTGSRAGAVTRGRTLVGLVLVFVAGMAVPLAVFAAPYALRGALGMLVEGVLVLPARRLQTASTIIAPQPLWRTVLLAPVAFLAVVPRPLGRLWPKLLLGAAVASLAAGWWAALEVGAFFWGSTLPVVAAFGSWRLWRRRGDPDSLATDRAMAVLAATCLVSLVQFPFTVPFYFCYFAPLLVLCAMATFSLLGGGLAARPGLVAGAIAVSLYLMLPEPGPMARLENPRGGLRVPLEEARKWDRVVEVVRAHARGPWVWAGPDAPEIAFLTGLRNPTRTIYDFFDRDYADDPRLRGERLLRNLEAAGVNVIALNVHPGFSGGYPPEIIAALRARYPEYEVLGQFIVGWRP
jgi:hypothetical protein